MPLQIVRNDITKMKVDAIVNAANESLLRAAVWTVNIVPQDRNCWQNVKRSTAARPGAQNHEGLQAAPANMSFTQSVRAGMNDGMGSANPLISCYRTSLMLAKEYGCESVAFPLISSGIFGYPEGSGSQMAIDTISSFLKTK